MNIVIAIDSFKGSLTSLEAGEAACSGIRRVLPEAKVTLSPFQNVSSTSPRLPVHFQFLSKTFFSSSDSSDLLPNELVVLF